MLPLECEQVKLCGISKTGHLVIDPTERDTFYHPIGNSIRCVRGGDPKDVTLLHGHSDVVNCVAISPDGNSLASAQLGKETDIIFWTKTKEQVERQVFQKKYRRCEHDLGVAALTFSHDSKLLASVGNDKDDRLYIWDVTTGNYVCNCSLKGTSVESAAWRGSLDNGCYVLVTGGFSGVLVWTIDTVNGMLSVTDCRTGSIKRNYSCIAFHENNEVFFAGTTSGDILSYVYKSRTLKDVLPVCKGRINVMTMEGGNNNKVMLVGSEDQHLYTFDTESTQSLPRVKVESGIKAIATEATDGTMYVSTADCTIWKVTKDLQVTKLEENHSSSITALMSTGRFAAMTNGASGSGSGSSSSMNGGSGISSSNGHGHGHGQHGQDMASVASASGSVGGALRWFSSDKDGNVCMWDGDCVMRAKHHVNKNKGKGVMVSSMSMVDDCLICGKSDGDIQLFSVVRAKDMDKDFVLRSEWELVHAMDFEVSSIVVSNGILSAGSVKGDVKVWDFATRRLISQRKEHVSAVTGISLIQNASVVVSISKDTSCKYYNWKLAISGVFFVMDASRLNSFCITPDENLLVCVGSDKYLTVWNLGLTETVFSVQAHDAEATCLSLSPDQDNRWVVTGGAERVLRLWDVYTGELLSVLKGHCSTVSCVKFITDTDIVSADESGALIHWKVKTTAS